MRPETHAVLIADVVGSSSRSSLRALLGKRLAAASGDHRKRGLIRLPYSVTAGDEFQTILADPLQVPEAILDLRVRLQPLQLRIGIGFGKIIAPIRPPVNRLGGPAFQLARTAIENAKRSGTFHFDILTSLRSENRLFDSAANLIYGLHDTLVLRVTRKQWETIAAYRATRRMESAAKRLDIDPSTVSRNLKRACFWQLEQTVKGVQALLDKTVF